MCFSSSHWWSMVLGYACPITFCWFYKFALIRKCLIKHYVSKWGMQTGGPYCNFGTGRVTVQSVVQADRQRAGQWVGSGAAEAAGGVAAAVHCRAQRRTWWWDGRRLGRAACARPLQARSARCCRWPVTAPPRAARATLRPATIHTPPTHLFRSSWVGALLPNILARSHGPRTLYKIKKDNQLHREPW